VEGDGSVTISPRDVETTATSTGTAQASPGGANNELERTSSIEPASRAAHRDARLTGRGPASPRLDLEELPAPVLKSATCRRRYPKSVAHPDSAGHDPGATPRDVAPGPVSREHREFETRRFMP
jgi:hypothetical protein